jgi:hypothetical protein
MKRLLGQCCIDNIMSGFLVAPKVREVHDSDVSFGVKIQLGLGRAGAHCIAWREDDLTKRCCGNGRVVDNDEIQQQRSEDNFRV